MPSYCSVFWRLWGCCHQRPHCRQHLHGQHLSQRTAGQTLTLLLRTDRNLVKALPWFQSVREKLLDPAYSSWFLRFDPKRKGNYSVATNSANITAQCECVVKSILPLCIVRQAREASACICSQQELRPSDLLGLLPRSGTDTIAW